MTNRAVRSALAALVGGVVLAACAGENLFGLQVFASGTGPSVDITTPTSGIEQVVGDSLLVEATVEAGSGAADITYSGIYDADGSPAYTAESAQGNGLTSLSLRNRLKAAPDQHEGVAIVIVSVTDLAGKTGADTVTVNIIVAN
jgi:hypothetical protein